MKSLARIGLVSSGATLDDVLNLQVDDLISRRLQSIVLKKLGFKTPYQARQAIIHGHIMIKDRKVDIPSYVVTLEEEEEVHFAPESKIPEILEKSKPSESEPKPEIEVSDSSEAENEASEKDTEETSKVEKTSTE